MKLPPLWKITRELKRPFQQLPSLPGHVGSFLFGARFYDMFLAGRIRQTDGGVPAGPRVAIYLIFPQGGLLESHKLALRYLRENNYAPLVVSNLPVTGEDAEYLKANCWRLLERPNVGYDFGGYRDGVLSLQGSLETLDRLVLLNDSSWFPLPGSRNWLQDAEDLGVDYAAAATSFGISRVTPDQYEQIQWEFDPGLRHFHYGSYALSVGPKLLRSKRYKQYWQKYPLTKKKNKVVRRGEIGMTRFALKNGFSHGATYDIRSLPEVLQSCSNAEINKLARSLTYLDDAVSQEFLTRSVPGLDAERSKEEREKLIKLMLTIAARIGVSYVLPSLLHKKHGFAFLKKSLVSADQENSDRVYDFAKTLDGPEGRVILKEIEDIRRHKGF